ncbi:MAG: glycoside-pentoside-hexuronide (GPH):cation symporter [Dehalococcoidia bacterium]|nr:glycoside-pentoside-hexuronide (GPH):cation symporter [Dehalococcoidia bacterium]
MGDNKLSVRTKLSYGIYDFGGNLFMTATAFVLLNYLTDTVGLAAALAGIALIVGRIWDAFYDPVIGYISDRTVTRMGRRRPFMLGGVIPLFIAMIVMFTNPALIAGAGISQTTLFIYAIVVYMILCTAYSTVNIPYSSLAPELTADYNERTSLNGYRFAFAAVGTLLGAGLALPIVAIAPDKNLGFVLMGLIFAGVMLASALITIFTVKEPTELKPAKTMGFLQTYAQVFKNGPYIVLLLAYILNLMAITIASATVIYYFKYILDAESSTTWAMLTLIGTAILFIPVSVVLSKKLGKKLVYGAGLVLMAVMLLILFFCGQTQGVTFTLITMFFMGIGFGFTYAIPYAMVADAIEYDYMRSGERREGAFFGFWTWGFKMGQALAVFLMGIMLEALGYVANVQPQPETAQLGIRLFMGPIPAIIFIIAAVILFFYPITEKRYQEILKNIAEMEAEKLLKV